MHIGRRFVVLVAVLAGYCSLSYGQQHFLLETSYLYGLPHSTEGEGQFDPDGIEVSLGITTSYHVYLGTYAEYWTEWSRNNLILGIVGVEAGLITTTPRTYKAISIGVGYPVKLETVDGGGERLQPQQVSLTYRAIGSIGFRLARSLWLSLRAGYKLQSMGAQVSPAQPTVASIDTLELSGVFFGAGLGFVL